MFNHHAATIKRLSSHIVQGGPERDEKWKEKAIKSLIKRVKKTNQLDDLEKAIAYKDSNSECIKISRSQDGRLQIAQKKGLPHVFYCQLWRWPDIHSHHELKPNHNCVYAFHFKKDEVCVNPYHYSRVEQPPTIMVPKYLPVASKRHDVEHLSTGMNSMSFSQDQKGNGALLNKASLSSRPSPSVHCLSHKTQLNQTSTTSLDFVGERSYRFPIMSSLSSEALLGLSSSSTSTKNMKSPCCLEYFNTNNAMNGFMKTEQFREKPNQSNSLGTGPTSRHSQELVKVEPMSAVNGDSPMGSDMLSGITNASIASTNVVSLAMTAPSLHVSPIEHSASITSATSSGTHYTSYPPSFSNKNGFCSSYDESQPDTLRESPNSNNTELMDLDMSDEDKLTREFNNDFLKILREEQENDPNSSALDLYSRQFPLWHRVEPGPETSPVAYQEPDTWCHIHYYEYKQRLGDTFYCSSPQLVVDGYTDPGNNERFCLGMLSNVNRTSEVEVARRHIGTGLTLYYFGGELVVQCNSKNSIFIQSIVANISYEFNPASVVKIPQGCVLTIFDNNIFQQELNTRVNETFEAVYEMQKMCAIRISFVKGWGSDYKRHSITETPCWIEIHLTGPLRWLDRVLQHMGSSLPACQCSSVS